MLEWDRCEGPIDSNDRYFVIDRPDEDCSEHVYRKCRRGMTDAERDMLGVILAEALANS
jgi:hypothetical protein